MIKRIFLLFLSSLCITAAWAQDNPGRRERSARLWESLSPERRELVLQNYRRYLALSPEERRRVDARFALFKSLPAKGREEMLWKWRQFQSLTPEKRQLLRRLQRPASLEKRGTLPSRTGVSRKRGVSRSRQVGPSGPSRSPRGHSGANRPSHHR